MSAGELEATTSADVSPEKPWWDRLLEPDRRPHAPGVWVVYFSLAALPLFGIGGWFVTDPVTRAKVFGLLVIYVACGMGLLLATSFLGLRKYLRQRRLQMPVEMTSTWIVVGVVMIVAMLLVAAILPRPSREYSLSQLPFTITSAARRASRFAIRKEGIADDAADNPATTEAKDGQTTKRKGGTESGKNDSADQQGDSSGGQKANGDGKGSGGGGKSQSSKGSGGKGAKGGKTSGSKGSGDSKSRDAESQSKENQKAESQSADSSNDPQQQPPHSQENNAPNEQQDASQPQSQPQSRWSPARLMTSLTSLVGTTVLFLLKTLFYGVLALGLLIAAWVYREEVAAAWKKLLAELRELWDWFFGHKKTSQEAAVAIEAPAPPRPFAAFADPFLTGDAARMTWPQLVRYTFEALEAWAREHDHPRQGGQTAQEFVISVAAIEPQIAPQLQNLGAWYNQLAYAPRSAAAGSPDPLRQLWHELRARQPRVAAVALIS
jgi:hypothetical protein